jgi:phage-related minor tail protein
LATTQDIIRRLVVVAEERGVTQLEARLRAVADAGGSVAAANATVATSTDRSERAVLSATRAFEGLERRFIPTAREASNLDRQLQQLIRFGQQTGEWGRVDQVFDAIAQSSQAAAQNVERLALAQRGLAEHFRNQVELSTGVTRTPASRLGASGSALAEQAAQMDKLEKEARELLQAIDPVGQAQVRLAEATERVNLMLKNGILAPQQAAAALKVMEHNATLASKGVSVTAAQFTNLGFQLNDVASGLLMGQSPMTILVQQGGQVYQALQGPNGVMASIREVGSRAAGFFTPARVALAGFAAAALYGATAVSRFSTLNKDFNVTVTGLGQGMGLTANQFREFNSAIAEGQGLSVSAAAGITNALARTGRISAENIKLITGVAKDMATTLGVEVPEATQLLANAFKNPAEGISTLNDQFQFMDAAAMRMVRSLIAQGNTQEAIRQTVERLPPALAKYEQNVGAVAKAWEWVKRSASDADLAVGQFLSNLSKGPDAAQRLKDVNAQLREAEDTSNRARQGRTAGTSDAIPGGIGVFSTGFSRSMMKPPAELRTQAYDAAEDARRQQQLQAAQMREASQREIRNLSLELEKMIPGLARGSKEFRDANDSLVTLRKGFNQATPALTEMALGLRGLTVGSVEYEQRLSDMKEALSVQEQVTRSLTGTNGLRLTQEQIEAEQLRITNQLLTETNSARIGELNARQKQLSLAGQGITTGQAENAIAAERTQQATRRAFAISEDIRAREKQNAQEMTFGRTQEISNQLLAVELQYRGQRMELSDREKEAFRGIIDATMRRNEVMQIGNRLYGEFRQPALDFQNTLAAINALMAQGVGNANQYAAAILDARIKMEDSQKTMQGGFNAGLLQLQKDFGDSSAMMKGFVTSTGNSMVTTLADITSGTTTASEGFKNLATTVLRAASEMIIKMMVLGPLMKMLGGAFGGGGAVGYGSGMDILAGVAHSGGIVGVNGVKRFVHPAYFENAPRFHSGGIAGNEIPAILRANEEVLTPENPRHIMNGGGGGTINVNVNGARGNQEIMDMVAAGVKQGIGSYDASLNQGGLARKMSNVRIRGQR